MSVVTVYPDDLIYSYQCRSCGLANQRTTKREVIDALIAHGAIVARRLADRSTGPAFTPDDVLAFHELLADDEALWADLEAAAQ